MSREEQLVQALVELEDACDEMAGARTETVYRAMLDAGMTDAMNALDSARRKACALVENTEAFAPIRQKRHERLAIFLQQSFATDSE